MNHEFLSKLRADIDRRFGWYLERILTTSAEHGPFGAGLLESLQAEIPKTSCENCGICCNAVSIFSLEYHRIVRDLMRRLPPERLKETFRTALHFDERIAEFDGESAIAKWSGERRIRCSFRDDALKICRIHSVRPFACRFFGLLKADGTRECPKVLEFQPAPPPLAPERLTQLQERIVANSETFAPFANSESVAFFPFEFWLFKAALGETQALRIYREILVPASSPLSNLWQIELATGSKRD
ncbi:MAG: YkgJ family cysteine cluster protein [Candidatus Ozemobacteraceae bacterium]